MQETGLEGMNAIGFAALALFAVGVVGALACIFVFDLKRVMIEEQKRNGPFGVWKNSAARNRFLAFVGFCALGPLSALIGFTFGGWPTN